MDKDFFIKLVFGTHKVADLLGGEKSLKEETNSLLVDLLMFCDENPVSVEQKRNILPRTLRKVDSVQKALLHAESFGTIDHKNFFILKKEYAKIPRMLVEFLESQKAMNSAIASQRNAEGDSELTMRQKKIVELLKNKEKTQIWELQKILPEVTKRTLRRDIDELLKLNLIERQGEWNSVYYRIK